MADYPVCTCNYRVLLHIKIKLSSSSDCGFDSPTHCHNRSVSQATPLFALHFFYSAVPLFCHSALDCVALGAKVQPGSDISLQFSINVEELTLARWFKEHET